jgi:hypothetical protein
MKNGNESDVDCGGSCNGCDQSKRCNTSYDCLAPYLCDDFSYTCVYFNP